MLRGKRCYHNDCNIMTPSYGRFVFISDLQLHSLNGRTQPSKRSCVRSHYKLRLYRTYCKAFRTFFLSVIKVISRFVVTIEFFVLAERVIIWIFFIVFSFFFPPLFPFFFLDLFLSLFFITRKVKFACEGNLI